MEKLRVGMIGTGGISHWHAKQLGELQEVEVTAIADPVKKNRDFVIQKYGFGSAETYDDYKQLLKENKPDAVVICTPHTMHVNHVIDALESGCHVLVEKPMACSIEEAERMIAVAESNQKVLQVSYQRHFEPPFLYIREAIASGLIGELTSITASLYQDWLQLSEGLWRQNPKLSGGGMLMDSGSHIIDVLLWTTGLKPVKVSSSLQRHGADVEIDSFTSIQFEKDVVAGLNIVGYAPGWHETYVFCGTEGGIFFENGKITVRRRGEEIVEPELPAQTTNQDKSFIDAILGRHEVKVPGQFALEVVRLTQKIYESAGYDPYAMVK
ncbi:MAG TPA: Gfo/Idh/MocA family oxidoreductase [Bacillales bacterium]|nr:Gfo/Idh/MocA family oxidoreductase [Bacillales bacterium]